MTIAETPAAFKRPPLAKVRAAVPEDFENIMELCEQIYEENGAVNVDWGIVENKIIQGVNGVNSCVGVIGNPIQGMIYLQFSSLWYSNDLVLEELFLYVPKEYRNTRNAQALLEFAKDCSDRLNVPLLIGIISNQRTAAKIRLYERLLGPMSGAFFLFNGKTGSDGV